MAEILSYPLQPFHPRNFGLPQVTVPWRKNVIHIQATYVLIFSLAMARVIHNEEKMGEHEHSLVMTVEAL